MKVKTEIKEEKNQEEAEEKIAEPIRKENGYEKTVATAMEGEKRLHINHSVKNRMGFFSGLLIFIERFLKLVAIFALSITGSIFLLTASFYLFTSSFGLKDSPAFQALRDRIGIFSAVQIEEEIQEAENDKDLEWKEELEEIKEDIKDEEEIRKLEMEEGISEKIEDIEEQEDEAQEKINEQIEEMEEMLKEKKEELKEMES